MTKEGASPTKSRTSAQAGLGGGDRNRSTIWAVIKDVLMTARTNMMGTTVVERYCRYWVSMPPVNENRSFWCHCLSVSMLMLQPVKDLVAEGSDMLVAKEYEKK
eukprot:CAMPEP_0174356644 /NCGR_PEP_ID=MMETSP0811_2-20130205/31113_1 /TAXON_ID=73025 ORGANISM="Eutreptiella gymnastica-like, Strain CCMP1594" /NCGR_SAMPLE_ID=MMETSP0811_2 /ASSEMBLY_ACC=CAM_ASM_000667 /LENGTH=103 /DNA_ID=CAMNT_0015488809 /DNA_START=33 /DNA_END=341 /DNA_ORIENTATION=+